MQKSDCDMNVDYGDGDDDEFEDEPSSPPAKSWTKIWWKMTNGHQKSIDFDEILSKNVFHLDFTFLYTLYGLKEELLKIL